MNTEKRVKQCLETAPKRVPRPSHTERQVSVHPRNLIPMEA